MAVVPAEEWEGIIAFYRELVGEDGWRQEPMQEFASWLASSEYSRVLFPSTSHAALGLSTAATYEERLRRPMVYIDYAEPRGFAVHWQRGQGDEVREEAVASPQSPEVFARILGWLGIHEVAAEPVVAPDPRRQ